MDHPSPSPAHAADDDSAGAPGASDSTRELGRFLDRQGRVAAWPRRQRYQALVLSYLAGRFEFGHDYAEREVNALLDAWHTWHDPAFLRRALYDARRLDRTPDGARYWRPRSGDEGT